MGTPEFAVPSLDMLVKEGYEILAVVTQPDKPKGRGKKVSMPPVKEYAIKNEIMVLQPPKIKTTEFLFQLKELNPDLLVTAAYGKILSKEILDVPTYGCINVHGSLLPKYRGAAPIHWAIINDEKETGITTMYTDIGLDTGDMLLSSRVAINEDTTVGELHDELSLLGAEVLKNTLDALKSGNLRRVKQNDMESTYAPMINKEVGKIDWCKDAEQIHNLVRGTNPWPGAYTLYKGSRMRVWKTSITNQNENSYQCGTILRVSDDGILVSTKSGNINILEVQFDSSKKMHVRDYIRGHIIDEGEVLG